MHTPAWLRALTVALNFMGMLAVSAPAQNMLLTEYRGKYLPVMKAVAERPYVQTDGQLRPAPGAKYALRKVEDYLPVLVTIKEFTMSTHAMIRDESAMNHLLVLTMQLESPEPLKDVFIVLEMDANNGGKLLYLHEVGELRARKVRDILIETKMLSELGARRFSVHIFSEGMEVLNSRIDAERRDQALDAMTARRILRVKNSLPQLLVGSDPEYPAALIKTNASGHVVVSIQIGVNGRVHEATVKQASDPLLGEAALAAVRLWRFLPQVRDGHPVEARADMPFDFVPPEAALKKS